MYWVNCMTKPIKVNDSGKTGENTKTIQLQRFSAHVVGICNVVKHLNVHVDYIPSHGDYPAWFRHLVIYLNVQFFC